MIYLIETVCRWPEDRQILRTTTVEAAAIAMADELRFREIHRYGVQGAKHFCVFRHDDTRDLDEDYDVVEVYATDTGRTGE